ncbi:MAG: hypothetical protein LBS45_06430 [Synergistaceae bacterium]|jgi:hypothetical protein|nr:hypothetical protein [Synergistaceae bacterium]
MRKRFRESVRINVYRGSAAHLQCARNALNTDCYRVAEPFQALRNLAEPMPCS